MVSKHGRKQSEWRNLAGRCKMWLDAVVVKTEREEREKEENEERRRRRGEEKRRRRCAIENENPPSERVVGKNLAKS